MQWILRRTAENIQKLWTDDWLCIIYIHSITLLLFTQHYIIIIYVTLHFWGNNVRLPEKVQYNLNCVESDAKQKSYILMNVSWVFQSYQNI